MANETISPNMNLPIPGVGSTAGPQYAVDLDSCMTIIDQHNHTSGNGVPINPGGLNINSDLPINGNNLTLVRSVRMQSQGSPISGASDLDCLSVSGVDLYYRDGNGNSIRMTQSGSIVGSAGSITGLPSGTASASYASGTFVWQSATNTSAVMDMGSIILRNSTASSHGLTLSPPSAMGADFQLVLPNIPGVQSIMALDNAGNMSAPYTVDNATIVISSNVIKVPNHGIQTVNLGSLGQQISSTVAGNSGAFWCTSSTSYVSVPNLTVTITTFGRPVCIELINITGSDASLAQLANTAPGNFYLSLFRGASQIATYVYAAGNYPAQATLTVDPVSAGNYTYTVQLRCSSGSGQVCIGGYAMAAYEL